MPSSLDNGHLYFHTINDPIYFVTCINNLFIMHGYNGNQKHMTDLVNDIGLLLSNFTDQVLDSTNIYVAATKLLL